jgi:hypothetical protein
VGQDRGIEDNAGFERQLLDEGRSVLTAVAAAGDAVPPMACRCRA